jgi:hypothetical protein
MVEEDDVDLEMQNLLSLLQVRVESGELPEKFVGKFMRWIEMEGALVEGTPDEGRTSPYTAFLYFLALPKQERFEFFTRFIDKRVEEILHEAGVDPKTLKPYERGGEERKGGFDIEKPWSYKPEIAELYKYRHGSHTVFSIHLHKYPCIYSQPSDEGCF